MKKILFLIPFLIVSLFGMSDRELAVTINLAGKQRMLTQKMSKEAFELFLGIDMDNAKKSLKASRDLFDRTLNGLIKGDKSLGLVPTKDKKIQAKLQEVKKLWEPFKKHIDRIYNFQADDKDYWYIKNNNMKLLKTMNEAVFMYAKLNKDSKKFVLANDINLAGRQRMLTQKIAKDILQYILNLDRKESLKDLQESVKLFDRTLKGLYNGDKELHLHGTKLPRIVNQLKVTQKEWEETKPLIIEQLKPENINNQTLTLKLLKKLDKTRFEMNKAVVYYTQSINRQKQVMKLNAIINSFLIKKNKAKHVVNLAGKQRMLTQRISKLTLQCGLNLLPGSCKKMEQFINLYQKTLIGFVKGDSDLGLEPTKSQKAIEQIKKITKLWIPFRDAAFRVEKSNGKDVNAIKYILNNNEELLKQSDILVKIFEEYGSKNITYLEKAQLRAVNIAGRQRMLTQKMTKEKLAIIALKMKDFKSKLKKSVKMFNDSLNGLINGNKEMGLPKATNKKIKEQLLKVQTIWNKLKPFYEKESLTQKELILVLKANPILLKEMDKGVKIIEQATDY